MLNLLGKFTEVIHKFAEKFSSEIQKNQYLKKKLEYSICKTPEPIRSLYKKLQFGDFLIFNLTKEYPIKITKSNNIDKFIDKIIVLPQYYGGLRENKTSPFFNKIAESFEKYLTFDSFKDFKVLRKIENETIPKILKTIVFNEISENVTLEAEETLKQLKNHIYEQENWVNKEIILEDVRKVEVEKIFIKNCKKNIKYNCEFTVVLKSLEKNKLRLNFAGSFEFIFENGNWIVSTFSFSPFN